MGYFEVEKELQIAVDTGKDVELFTSSIDRNMERQLRLVLEGVLKRYNHEHLYDTMFTCILELATNGTKANMKHIYYLENPYDKKDSDAHAKHLLKFKKIKSNSEWLKTYAVKSKEMGYYVKIIIQYNIDGITIKICNNLPLLHEDEIRIRDKFEKAMKYDDLISFYQDHHDDTEGEGLGFALNVIMLKGENIDPSLFRIGNVDGHTVARLEIPLTKNFKSARNST